MRRQLQLFLCAVQMLTRIPTPQLKGWAPDWIARSAIYYPVVGALVGCSCTGVFWLSSLAWRGALPAVLAIGAGVLITGAFHEDGLADAADGLLGGTTPERRLAIMKDSRIGSYGALALGLVLATKVLALASLPLALGALGLISAHVCARAAAVGVMWALPYAGNLTTAKLAPAARVRSGEMMLAAGLGEASLLLAPPGRAVVGLAAGLVAAGLVAVVARRRIGGWTGDVAGAAEQVFEAAFLLALAAR
ncbi:MAG: adenosylcobinamide-GDP ribazoletransferase [Caulobacteraceae bacterium]